MKRTLPWILVASLTALAPLSTAYAVDLLTSGGFTFDVTETGNGYVSGANPTQDPYDFMFWLSVDGTNYTAGGTAAATSLGGRQYDMAEITMGSLQVSRHVYVPSSGGNWIRYIDTFRNPTGAAVTATVRIYGRSGADATLTITGSSTGDTTVNPMDNWFTVDDSMATGGDVPTGYVVQGPNGSQRATAISAMVSGINADIGWTYDITVPAGGSVSLLTFGIQESDRASTITTSQQLSNPACVPSGGADPLLGLDGALRSSILNFALAGAPIPCFTTVVEAPEGDAITVEVAVTDYEMDPTVTWSWDIDGDGTFGEMADTTMITVPMGVSDGPGQYPVGIETSDGTNTRRSTLEINITNIEPTIVSTPPLMAGVNREYRYELMVDDPAGALDPINYVLTSRPMGMTVDAAGVITWTPDQSQRAMTFPVILRIDDGDGGEDLQMWEIAVAENTVPSAPVPMSPIDRTYVSPDSPPTLTVTNAVDEDSDTLVYFFRLSQNSSFLNADVLGSGELDEGTETTSWAPAEPLAPGLWYWEVWVNDGIGDSAHRYAQFIVGEETVAMPDAGPPVLADGGSADAGTVDGGGGCSAAPAAPSSLGLAWLVGLAGLALFRRRRRA